MRRLLLCAALLAAVTAPGLGATLTGTVLDPSGAGALNATVSLRNEAGEIKTTATDAKGLFGIDLAPGTYQVRITLAGFDPVERSIIVEEKSKPAVLEITLVLAEKREEVEVGAKPGALANSDTNYRALRESQPKETLAVNNLVLKRDVGVLTLKSGRISFGPPVLGRVTMAAFTGEGTFTLQPATALEHGNLRLITGRDSVEESFNRLVLCFTDDTCEEIKRRADKGPDEPPERDTLRDFRLRVRHRADPPRSMLDYLLTWEAIDNIESDILADLYNPQTSRFLQRLYLWAQAR